MRNTFWFGAVLVVAALGVVGGCKSDLRLASRSALSGGMWTVKIQSSAFQDSQPIPAKYTQEGENLSPPLKWSKGPSGLKEWILIVEDADTRIDGDGNPAVHWMAYKIPGSVTELPEGAATAAKFAQGKNYLGENGYAGPIASEKRHRYFFQIFAVDTEQTFAPGITRAELAKQLKGFVLSKGMLIGTYQSPAKQK